MQITKKTLQEQAWNCYENLCEEEKDKKKEHGRNIYKNVSKTDKQKLKG